MAKKLMFIITIVLFFLIIGVVGTSYATDNINVYTYLFDGRENGKDVVDNTSGVIIDKTLPRDYGYGLAQPSSDYEVYNRITPTDEEYNESAVADISKEQLVYTVLDDSIKGKFSILYKNSGKYNGIDIDVKATLMDWSVNESCTTGFPLFGFWKEYIDSDLRFISYAKIKYEFFISGTAFIN